MQETGPHFNKLRRKKKTAFSALLSRGLSPTEIALVLRVVDAERDGKKLYGGRLGIAESLIARNWLRRDPDGSLHASHETKALLLDTGRKS